MHPDHNALKESLELWRIKLHNRYETTILRQVHLLSTHFWTVKLLDQYHHAIVCHNNLDAFLQAEFKPLKGGDEVGPLKGGDEVGPLKGGEQAGGCS